MKGSRYVQNLCTFLLWLDLRSQKKTSQQNKATNTRPPPGRRATLASPFSDSRPHACGYFIFSIFRVERNKKKGGGVAQLGAARTKAEMTRQDVMEPERGDAGDGGPEISR